MRILSMLLLLAVLYMLIVRARDPDTWRWFAAETGPAAVADAPPNAKAKPQLEAKSQPEANPQPEAAAKPAEPPGPEPVAKGPTDEDPDELAAIHEEFQAITDKTLQIQEEEMFAYRRVVQWVVNQPISLLRRRARKDLTFNDFMLSPDKHRGALVELVLDAKMVRATDYRATDGSDLYEIWGVTTDSGAWLYAAIVVGLPEGMPVATRINERVRFVGYFFKLQGYHEANAKPHAPPLAAPMLIGRVVWIQPPAAPRQPWDASWTILVAAGFVLVIGLQLLWLVARPNRRRSGIRPVVQPKSATMPLDEWLAKTEEISDSPVDAPLPNPEAELPGTLGGGNGKPTSGAGPFAHPLDEDGPGGG
jgi:hypothetical protein